MSVQATNHNTSAVSMVARDWPAKRALDIALALLVLVATVPLLVAITCLILIGDKQHPLYFDERVGRKGKTFRCVKFRTMRSDPAILDTYLATHPDEAESYRIRRKLAHDPRTTRLGVFLRKTSLDELPQAFNVLAGHMSFVGPRPITQRELIQRHVVDQELLISVRPGITGLWQISGRCELSDRDRVALDNLYVRNASLTLDAKILARTPVAVLFGKGAR